MKKKIAILGSTGSVGRQTVEVIGRNPDLFEAVALTGNHNALCLRGTCAMERLAGKHGFLVCEGSGSPVELNMMDRDIANVGLMRETGINAILVGDIERGGVFAAIYGTWRLIPEDVRGQLRGFVINRFRGDASILEDGIRRIEELTGMKCLGVLPFMDLRFPEEDSLSDSSGRLVGTDAHDAFMKNIDEFTDVSESSGFDFDALISLSERRSSA